MSQLSFRILLRRSCVPNSLQSLAPWSFAVVTHERRTGQLVLFPCVCTRCDDLLFVVDGLALRSPAHADDPEQLCAEIRQTIMDVRLMVANHDLERVRHLV